MVPLAFQYTVPKSLDEALRLLTGGAKPLAGGMSLIPMMKLRLATPEHLVDLSRLKELSYIREAKGELHIGATTTHAELESSPLVRARCPLLAETARAIGDLQVRNRGTIGGSVAHADPSADYPAALHALEARFVAQGTGSTREVATRDFFKDSFTVSLEAGEIVREIIVPVEGMELGASYQKMAQPASGFAIVGVAARVRRSAGRIEFVRLGVTGLGNRAFRATASEQKLEGTLGTDAEIQEAAALVGDEIAANSDLHASAEFRRHLAKVFAARALSAAVRAAA